MDVSRSIEVLVKVGQVVAATIDEQDFEAKFEF